ncbi:hypothetical protein QTP88_004093 [Uroleucon formosanum]
MVATTSSSSSSPETERIFWRWGGIIEPVRIVYETEIRGIRGVGARPKCACVRHQEISCARVSPGKIQ